LLCLAFFMAALQSSSVFTAAPSIARDLGFSAERVQWMFTAYALTFGGLLMLGGQLADLFGSRRMFMAGVALFVLSSLLCGLAWSPGALIGARAVQGASAAVMSPAALSLVVSTFSDSAERNAALGTWSALAGIGATAGLLFGGLVTEGLGWQWVFFLNLPVGVGMLAASPILLREGRRRGHRRALDPVGAVCITAALVLLVYAITQAPQARWTSTQTIGLLVAAAVLMASFGFTEARSAAPLLRLRMLRSRALVGGNLVVLAAGMCIDGMLFTFTLYAQQVLGYSAIQFGLTVAVATVTSIAGSYVAQRTVTKAGFRSVATVGMMLLGVSFLLLSRIPVHGPGRGDLFVGLLLFGLGIGSSFVAGSIASLSDVVEQDSGVAAGLQNTSSNIGTALGVAILSTVASARTAHLTGPHVPPRLIVLTEGYHAAFVAGAVIAVLGSATALTLLSPPPCRSRDRARS
jgi:EmrB/QacA subfamily drug resistance transporter